MLEKFRHLLKIRRDLAEIETLGERELADLGLGRDQIRALASLPDDVPGRVAAMGRVFGLDEIQLSARREVWAELLSVCHRCRELPSCQAFMDRGVGGPAEAGFCPNWAEMAEIGQPA